MRGPVQYNHHTLALLALVTAASPAMAQDPAPPATPPAAAIEVAPPPPPAPPVVAAAPAPASRGIALRDIDREMSDLANDIGQSYTRLQQITGMVLSRSGGGAQLIIEHQNQMGSTFRLVRATYSLDGATIGTRVDEGGSLADQQSFTVYNGRVASGEHSVTVSLEYQGNGYGIFSYIRGYTFRSRSVQNFTVPEGRALRLNVVGYERGGATTAIEDRPAIRYESGEMTLQAAQALSATQPAQGAQGAQGAQPAQPQ
ncbi:MAG: hypothetical protein R3A48_13725 [Polyangiales bacterium]